MHAYIQVGKVEVYIVIINHYNTACTYAASVLANKDKYINFTYYIETIKSSKGNIHDGTTVNTNVFILLFDTPRTCIQSLLL